MNNRLVQLLKAVPVRDLIARAIEARDYSYCPYSGYAVGAALLAKDGKTITGCNIENAAYGPSNCAERTAFFKAVSEGVRSFKAIAIVGSPKGKKIDQFAFPCGVCRQVMMEFCDPGSFIVIVAKSETDYKVFALEELLPEGFGPANLDAEAK
ncbi:MAG: cytidine deaminase [Lachnospiraceae bacterium]|nr:cytidine deaminase [Lachnospiraceae bacterium]